jgi:hypothetical protein
VTGLAFSADGTRLASAVEEPVLQVDEDGLAQRQPAAPSVLLWNLDLASWNTAACEVAGRNLSRAEWTRYVGPEVPYQSASNAGWVRSWDQCGTTRRGRLAVTSTDVTSCMVLSAR